jgi:hypothetical protein
MSEAEITLDGLVDDGELPFVNVGRAKKRPRRACSTKRTSTNSLNGGNAADRGVPL